MTSTPASPSPESAKLSANEVWARVRAMVEAKPSLLALVDSVRLQGVDRGVATLLVKSAGELAQFKPRAEQFREWLEKAAGAPMRVEFKVDAPAGAAPVQPKRVIEATLVRQAEQNPLVQHAMKLFDARIVDVSPSEEA